MAKAIAQINPAIYATEFLFRKDMIWKAMSAAGSMSVKDPVAYLNRMEKKYGAIVKEAAGLAYEPLAKHCLAVVQDKIDEALCERYGWQTIEAWRAEDLIKMRAEYAFGI